MICIFESSKNKTMTKQDQQQLQKALEMMQQALNIVKNIKSQEFIQELRMFNKADSKIESAISSLNTAMINTGAK